MDEKAEEGQSSGIEVVQISKEEEKKLLAYLEKMDEALAKEKDVPGFIKEQIVEWKEELAVERI